MDLIFYIFQYVIFFYALGLVTIYTALMVMSFIKMNKYLAKENENIDELFLKSPFVPGISIVAPAYNEEVTIVNNVNSMLTVNYPTFEVVIVNDGSKDETLPLLIKHFELVETPYAYVEKIKTEPFKRIFKSTNPKFSKLTVVDKENGGTKADASNAGVNVAKYPYFICTDVDCVLARNALTKMIQPFINTNEQVIAVGATMRMGNSSRFEKGEIVEAKLPKGIIPLYQEIEYLRSYLIGKLGFSVINAVHNVSGGLGLFDKQIVIDAGGYDPLSHAEDMDMTTRMIAYMINYNRPYKIDQIPDTCCWTEGPPNLKVLNRQRTRWARGLLQIFSVHRKFMFRRRYKNMGMISFPYVFLFEFMAPLVELSGYIATIFFLISGGLNIDNLGIMLLFVYVFGLSLSFVSIYFDRRVKKIYKSSDYLRLIFFCLFEPIIYHPLIVLFSIKGYFDYLFKKNFEWGQMTRQGFAQNEETQKFDTLINDFSILKGLKVLVLEDDKTNQILAKKALKDIDAIYDICENGQIGLEAFRAKGPNYYDIILMDLNMPVMDGYMATEEIKKINKNIPIIAITGLSINKEEENLETHEFSGIVTKPYKSDTLYNELAIQKEHSQIMSNSSALKGLKVLVLEDDKINQILAKKTLNEIDAVYDICENGKIGLELFKAKAPNYYDVILMDLNMPVMDGYKATQEIKKINKHIPVIAITGLTLADEEKNIENSEFSAIVTKPYNADTLYNELISKKTFNN